MRTRTALSGALICIALLAAGCSQKSDPAEPSAAAAPSPAPAPAEVLAEAPAPLPEMPVEAEAVVPQETPEAVAPVEPTPAEPARPAPVAAPAPAAAVAPAAVVATPDIVDPGGIIAVAATKPGLKRIGSEDCGDCHDVQYDSWVKDPHGTRTPPLDCESCHGPGSEYKAKAVMEDPARARAAGLVIPDKDFCAQCHKKGVNDAFMKRVHAHAD